MHKTRRRQSGSKHKMKLCACIYQYGCKWHNDGVCQHIPHLNAKPGRNGKLRFTTLDILSSQKWAVHVELL